MRVLLANPRGFCAGVDRAIRIVEAAIEQYGSPIYVRHEIVHNHHVLESLRARGAIFVEDLDDMPPDVTVVFSAHGVSPAVARRATERNLRVLDATCPLVTKVHQEVVKHSRAERTVLVIGHRGHPEVVGTVGHYAGRSDRVIVIGDEQEAATVQVADPQAVAYVTQTTLSVDSTASIIATLRRRFPAIRGPHAEDICYATQNRQRAVQALAQRCEAIVVIGASHSSNSVRLREVAEAAGARAWLVESDERVERAWFDGVGTIGVTSGASVPEWLVERLLAKFRGWWPTLTTESIGEPETIHFRMPRALTSAAA